MEPTKIVTTSGEDISLVDPKNTTEDTSPVKLTPYDVSISTDSPLPITSFGVNVNNFSTQDIHLLKNVIKYIKGASSFEQFKSEVSCLNFFTSPSKEKLFEDAVQKISPSKDLPIYEFVFDEMRKVQNLFITEGEIILREDSGVTKMLEIYELCKTLSLLKLVDNFKEMKLTFQFCRELREKFVDTSPLATFIRFESEKCSKTINGSVIRFSNNLKSDENIGIGEIRNLIDAILGSSTFEEMKAKL